MITGDYLNTSRVVRGLKQGPLGEHIHLYIDWLQRRGYSREIGQRHLSLARDFGVWLAATGSRLDDIEDAQVIRYLAERARHRPRYRGDALALARLLSVLRDANVIALRLATPRNPREELLQAYSLYMERARGLAPTSIASHVWFLRPFLQELGIATNADVVSLTACTVSRYVERHAGDSGATTARIMCSRLRVFLRYLLCEGFIPDDLTGVIPSIRRAGNPAASGSNAPRRPSAAGAWRTGRHGDRQPPPCRRRCAPGRPPPPSSTSGIPCHPTATRVV